MNKGGDTGGIQVYEREVPWHLTSPELPATMRAIFVKIVKNDIGSTSQYLKIGNHFGRDLTSTGPYRSCAARLAIPNPFIVILVWSSL